MAVLQISGLMEKQRTQTKRVSDLSATLEKREGTIEQLTLLLEQEKIHSSKVSKEADRIDREFRKVERARNKALGDMQLAQKTVELRDKKIAQAVFVLGVNKSAS